MHRINAEKEPHAPSHSAGPVGQSLESSGKRKGRRAMLPDLKRKLRAIAAVLVVAVAGVAAIGPGAPPPSSSRGASRPAVADAKLTFTGYVVDQAGVLGAAEQRKLTVLLDGFERETGHQFAVVTVDTLGGQDVAAFTTRLANRWGVGRKDINDGIVLLVAPHERKARIAVGYGLERELPDDFCQDVMDREMIPAFARGEIGAGVEAGVSAIIRRLAATSSDTP